MELTERYKLKKPEVNDYIKVEDLNENMDILDKEMGSLEDLLGRIKDSPIPVTLTAAGWTGSAAPYVQTVAAEGIKGTDNPILVSMLADGATEAAQKAYNKAFGIVAAGTGTTGDGTVTFKVYKKPATDLIVGLKGV